MRWEKKTFLTANVIFNNKIKYKYWKQINISVTLVSESYVILYYEKKFIFYLSIKICLNQILHLPFKTEQDNLSS